MIKVQFFLLVETLIFSLALFDALASQSTRILLAFAILLFLLGRFLQKELFNALTISSAVLLFLVFALNLYFVLGSLLAIAYIVVNAFARFQKRTQYVPVNVDQDLSVDAVVKTKWFGVQEVTREAYGFEDINIIRLVGTDIIDLEETIVTGGDNMVLIRKLYGKTKIIIPVDVEIALSATSLYGKVTFLEKKEWQLRNDSILVKTSLYSQSHRRVKVLVNTLYGDVEVVRV
ncbi:cell wall-active antibiotics response protein LiaF [Streptococcus sp. DD13]|uniref:cell wall-active antibiotics response protein LiaF n=1 Tax=Streptococcus sp. DD13 TaxID=1777881 RepID=UPI00079BB225|nr:cell wall-active antibiotics response protein LiaF [Streptococcus sp. DD13]KXT77462.1 hypothetical protein STRDD13_01495 [Streptococcus sp. DD13]